MNALQEELREQPEKAQKALIKAQKQEEKKIKRGYRYIQATKQTCILVECDKDGQPTAKGLEHIKAHQKRLGLLKTE